MATSDLVNLIAAIFVGGGTLFLGIMAWRTIRQTRNIQKAEKRERLLNEIIEWATDISKCGVEGNYEIWRTFTARYFDKVYEQNIKVKLEDFLREKSVIGTTEIGELILSFSAMRGKSHYITKIASIFGQDLQNAVMKLVDDLEVHIKLLSKCMKDRVKNLESIKEGNSNYIEDIGDHKQQLDLSAAKVVEEATEIKTREIG